MLKKILIANRGEIAVRVIRACREMGIATVAVYSDIDKDALHTQLADEAVCIGSAMPKDSYLNMANILSACVLTGADAIHPGFGFLSENSKFAKMCRECNIKFIGPDYETIDFIGDKAKAREIMKFSDVPVVPGYEGEIRDENHALELAKEIGYPIMIKASAGGGGKGIRIAFNDEEFLMGFKTAKAEAKACFGNDTLYLE
ncbi:biotin carboxylase N-terminal domain-containing protein, partial [Clostridium butyricum]